MIYVGVFVRLFIFTSWGGEALVGRRVLEFWGAYGRENECHVMVLGGIWTNMGLKVERQ
jgi:hypothetical protein